MEGVVHRAEVRVVHALHIARGLLHRVQQVGLEAVQRLDGALHARRLRDRGDGAVHLGGVVQFGLGRVPPGELAQHLVVGTAQGLHAGLVRAVEHRFRWSIAPWRFFASGEIALCASSGSTVTAVHCEAVVLDHLAHLREVRRIAHVEDRNLHAVVAHGLELGEKVKVIFGHVTGPEEQIESNFHR